MDTWAATTNGPYRLGASLVVALAGSLRLVPSNQTFDPIVTGVKVQDVISGEA